MTAYPDVILLTRVTRYSYTLGRRFWNDIAQLRFGEGWQRVSVS
jgi:hypothetical protein